MALLKRREIDRIYNALRPRINRPSGGVAYTPPTVTIPPHTHSADQITSNASTYVAADDVQEAIEELDSEKLARSGDQEMLGDLNMDEHSIDNAVDVHASGDINMDGGVGAAKVGSVRVLTLAGDDDDGEARITGAERVIFNNEPTKSVIENPSRLDMNVGVEAGVSYTPAEGKVSWDSLEDTLVVYVASGASIVLIAAGWAVKLAVDGTGIPV